MDWTRKVNPVKGQSGKRKTHFNHEIHESHEKKQKFNGSTGIGCLGFEYFVINHVSPVIQHPTSNIQHSTFNIQHPTFRGEAVSKYHF